MITAALATPIAGALGHRRLRQAAGARQMRIEAPNGIDERGYVRIGGIDQWISIRIGGALQVLVDDEVTTLNEGDFLLVPPHTPPRLRRVPRHHGRRAVHLHSRYAALRLSAPARPGHARRASPQEIKDSSELYDNHYVDSPLWRATLEAAAE